jgi:antitoxin ParD1/3/4
MRTNIVIDPGLLDAAMRAGPYKTKKDAVEAGLKLLARQAAYREVLRWEGKLKWDGEAPAATVLSGSEAGVHAPPPSVQDQPAPPYVRRPRR